MGGSSSGDAGDTDGTGGADSDRGFAATRWSVVVATGDSDLPTARRALSWLCEAYWQPLLDHVRRRGVEADEAQDVVQDFFTRLLEKRDLQADASRGRFRAYLIGAMNHFLANHWDRQRAQKRGGAISIQPLADQAVAADLRGPDQAFARAWALTLLERVLERLARDYQEPRQARLFATLRSSLTGETAGTSYAEAGRTLGMSEGAVKVAVHRLRSRYREFLRLEIAETVASPAEIDDELRELMSALRS